MQHLAHIFCSGGLRPAEISLHPIVQHMQRLLNSAQGQSASSPQYGLSMSRDGVRDALALLPQTTALLERVIVQALAAHEPRLQHWRVRQQAQVAAQALTLFLTARLVRSSARDVLIDVDVAPSGRMTVRQS